MTMIQTAGKVQQSCSQELRPRRSVNIKSFLLFGLLMLLLPFSPHQYIIMEVMNKLLLSYG